MLNSINIKKIYTALIIFSLLFAKNKTQAQPWPALFEDQDFIPVEEKKSDKKKLNINGKNIDKASPLDIRKKLYNSFQFIDDFGSETRNERPRNWIDPKKNPEKALEIGYPKDFKRPAVTIHYPIYPLTKLYYFKGDNIINSTINICQTYWVQSLYQKTHNCFSQLQTNILRKVYPATPLLKMQVNMLESFFMLHLLVNKLPEIQNISFSTDPPTMFPFKENEILNTLDYLFYYISTRFDETTYIPEKISSNVIQSYADFFEYPSYLINHEFKETKKYTLTMDKNPIDPLTWIQSIMPLVYINSMSLNNTPTSIGKSFDSIDKLENFLKWFKYPLQKQGSVVQTTEFPKINDDIFLKPSNNDDLLSVTDLFKAIAFQSFGEPDTALRYISKGILRNVDPDLTSLLFKASADAYFDLNILQLARRSYSWSELYSKNFAFKVPAILFFGAESAFWIGQYDIAKKGYESFLLASGEEEFSPQARLRIAVIEQLQGHNNNAQSDYEYILRNLNEHPIANDATVNLFCMNVDSFTPHVRKIEYEKVMEKIKSVRPDLLRQAKACLMKSDLIVATEETKNEVHKNVVEKVKIQQDIIDKYNKEFPENEFIVLFADRIKQLNLSQAPFLASQNKCKELIEYYGKNKTKLNALSKHNNEYVKGLKWDSPERTKLLRCAALLKNYPLWQEARLFKEGKDGNPLQDKYYTFAVKPSSYAALELYFELKKSAKVWNVKLQKIEKSGPEVTDRRDFWEMLSLHNFLNYKLSADDAATDMLLNSFVRDLLKEPKLIFELPIFCSWFLQDLDKLSSADFDIVAKIKSPKEWLKLLSSPSVTNNCESSIAQNLLTQSQKLPSEERDKLILLPFLKKRGYAEASEDWLAYVQRLEQQGAGISDQNVLDIYTNLSKVAKDNLVKSAASMWIKKNLPKSSDKVLW